MAFSGPIPQRITNALVNFPNEGIKNVGNALRQSRNQENMATIGQAAQGGDLASARDMAMRGGYIDQGMQFGNALAQREARTIAQAQQSARMQQAKDQFEAQMRERTRQFDATHGLGQQRLKLQQQKINQGAAPPTSVREYNTARKQGFQGSFMDFKTALKKAGATSITVGSKGKQKFFEKLGGKHADEAEKATADLKLLPTIEFAQTQLDNGALTGAFSDLWRQGYAIGNAAGWNTDEMNKGLAATEAFGSQTGVLVGNIIRLFGAGTGLSDADREYAKKIAGGDLSMSRRGLERILSVAKYRAWEQSKETRDRLVRVYGDEARTIVPELPPEPPKPDGYGPGAGPQWLKQELGGPAAPTGNQPPVLKYNPQTGRIE